MANEFTWVPIYQELASELANWQDRQGELIGYLESLRSQDYKITPLMDKDENGASFLLNEMDPFTFFGVFNRGIRNEQRIAILSEMKKHFKLQNQIPVDFEGVPILNNMSSWFISYQGARKAGDTERLWKVFRLALSPSPLDSQDFFEAFDEALTVRRTNVNLTMGLFWIRPDIFLNLDQVNRSFLNIKLPPRGLNAAFYMETLRTLSSHEKSFPALSYQAWLAAHNKTPKDKAETAQAIPSNEIQYWLVGAYWDDGEPADQTQRFLNEGIWENGYHERYLDEVKSMQANDKIAIKAASTQRRGLPFDNRNKTISRMEIKAIGTIVTNRGDGRTVEVEWEPDFQEKYWYFFTNRSTVWHLKIDEEYKLKDLSRKLADFVWFSKAQDYAWFCERWWGIETPVSLTGSEEKIETIKPPYGPEDILAEGVFLDEQEIAEILERWEEKKAAILQGPPGVGKTFIARKLAYALMKEIDPMRLEMVQFHQSYSYDDFIRGYRPIAGQAGTFGLQNGVFYDFCQKAINDPEREYVFIIDEINRGNLSQIFGELLMLIEHDKRGERFSVPLVYRHEYDEPRFYVPSNLYLMGLMNVADRSLALVDYALRRRFVFFTLKPQYESELFRQWLLERAMDSQLVRLIVERMSRLNKMIREDALLGENYQVGHSYFCPPRIDFSGLNENWFRSIMRTEVIPLLREYWFDNPRRAEEAERELLA